MCRQNRLLSPLESIDQFYEFLKTAIRRKFPFQVLRVAATSLMSLTYSRIVSCAAVSSSRPRSMRSRPSGWRLLFCEPPFFSSKFRWIDARTSSKASKPFAGREDASGHSLIVVKEYRALPHAILEHHGTRGISVRSRRVRRPGDHRYGGFRIIFTQRFSTPRRHVARRHRLFDFPPNREPSAASRNLGVAVEALQHGLGHVAEEMVVAVAMRHVETPL